MSLPEADARGRILDAAERAFADHGMAGARGAAIAHDPGGNKARPYYYVGNKEEPYEGGVERVFGQIMERARLSGALDPQAGFESLAGFIEGYATVIDAHPAFVRLLLRGGLYHRDVVDERRPPRIPQG